MATRLLTRGGYDVGSRGSWGDHGRDPFGGNNVQVDSGAARSSRRYGESQRRRIRSTRRDAENDYRERRGAWTEGSIDRKARAPNRTPGGPRLRGEERTMNRIHEFWRKMFPRVNPELDDLRETLSLYKTEAIQSRLESEKATQRISRSADDLDWLVQQSNPACIRVKYHGSSGVYRNQ